ncbi:MAG: NUDIX domain-containing protein [Nakamurella sp.]
MAIPEFVLALRERIGTLPLWLIGCTAVVVRTTTSGDDDPEILMVRRADNGAWTPVTGIVDPGEHPGIAAVREVAEEAAVTAVVERLAQVGVTGEVVYPNGDRTQYLDLTFRCREVPGTDAEPHPADGENTEAGWVRRSVLPALDPPVQPTMLARIDAALADEVAPRMVALERG